MMASIQALEDSHVLRPGGTKKLTGNAHTGMGEQSAHHMTCACSHRCQLLTDGGYTEAKLPQLCQLLFSGLISTLTHNFQKTHATKFYPNQAGQFVQQDGTFCSWFNYCLTV
jgi:hypothetical protein